MARVISELLPPCLGRPPKYPWDMWTDGRVWEVVRGEDFDCNPRNFMVNAYQVGKRRGLKVSGRITDNSVAFQFREDRV